VFLIKRSSLTAQVIGIEAIGRTANAKDKKVFCDTFGFCRYSLAKLIINEFGSDHIFNKYKTRFGLDDLDHNNVIAKGLPIAEKIRRLDSSFNSKVLD
jgi:hypothetical protein